MPARQLPQSDPMNLDLLVYDDLACSGLTDWGKEVVAALLEERHATEKATIVTTNLKPNDLAAVIDSRTVSRILEGGKVLAFPETDLRLKV